jgi:prolyl-tRNA synthetase
MTTRLIGGMIMCHGDDDGVKLPPRIASKQVVIIPVIPKPDLEQSVIEYAEKIAADLRSQNFYGYPVSVLVDKRDRRGGEKTWEWIKKGVPLRIEVGPRDLEANSMMIARRDRPHKEKTAVAVQDVKTYVLETLEDIQKNLYQTAKDFRDKNIVTNIKTFEEMKAFFTPKNTDKPEIHGGFVLAKWCGDLESEKMLDEIKVTIRCLPTTQSGTTGTCILTGKPATIDAIFAKSY